MVFHKDNGRSPYLEWLKSLDIANRSRIVGRVTRFQEGLFGDHKPVGFGILEARFFFGSGYRVYFSIIGTNIVLLLMGGDKSSQSTDIRTAKEFLRKYLEDEYANKKH